MASSICKLRVKTFGSFLTVVGLTTSMTWQDS